MTEAVESVCVLGGALSGGEGGVEDVERGDGQLALHLRREEETAAECLTVYKYFVFDFHLSFIFKDWQNVKFK